MRDGLRMNAVNMTRSPLNVVAGTDGESGRLELSPFLMRQPLRARSSSANRKTPGADNSPNARPTDEGGAVHFVKTTLFGSMTTQATCQSSLNFFVRAKSA